MRNAPGVGIETDVFGLMYLLQQQPEGDKGVMRTDGFVNIFYINNRVGVVKAVNVRWDVDGWRVCSFALGEHKWDVGTQVFSRNSGN